MNEKAIGHKHEREFIKKVKISFRSFLSYMQYIFLYVMMMKGSRKVNGIGSG